LSLIDIHEEITAPFFPLILPRVSAAFPLQRSDADANSPGLQLKVSIGDTVVLDRAVEVAFNDQLRARLTIDFRVFQSVKVERSNLLYSKATADWEVGQPW
jgi:hypothetical protein